MSHAEPANLGRSDRPPRRRRSIPMFVRCGLGVLVVLGLSAAIIIQTRISRQRPIINEIERARGLYGTRFEQNQGIHYDWLGRIADALGLDRAASDIVVVELNGPNVTDATLACLEGLPTLETLVLDGRQITDDSLKQLAGITGLRRLVLRDTSVTDDGLLHLKGLRGLKLLSLCGSEITDAGLVQLKDLAALESLDLSRTAVTDAGVEPWRRFQGSKRLGWMIRGSATKAPPG